MASVLPPETVFRWRLDGLDADSFAVGTTVEWPSPSFLALGLTWHVRLVPDVRIDGGRFCGMYLYLETPDSTCSPAVAEIAVEGGLSLASRRLLLAPFSTKKPAPEGSSRNWGYDKMVSHWSLTDLYGFEGTLVVRVRLRARSFDELEVPTPHSTAGTLKDDMMTLLGDEAHMDVRFRCSDGGVVGAHSVLLAARSPTLRALLHGPLAAKLPTELHVPDWSAAIMTQLIHFLYTDEVWFHSPEEAQHLLYAADFYDINRLRTLCERELHYNLSMANALDILALAHTCNCMTLRSTALRFVAQHAAEVMSGHAWASLQEVHPELDRAVMHTVAHGEPPQNVVPGPRTPPRRHSSASPEYTVQRPRSSSS